MFLRRHFIAMVILSASVVSATAANAALPPEVRRELSELTKELNEVKTHVKKKELELAKEILRKVEDRVATLGIDSDEKDRAYSTFRSQLEKARNQIPIGFEHDVAPILKMNCLQCHGESQAGANLKLDTFNGIVKGGRNGIPVTPGNPARSGIMVRIMSPNERTRMPKDSPKLSDEDIQTIARWIGQGAAFDGTDRDAPIGESAAEQTPPKKSVKVVFADGSETVSFRTDIAPWLVNICMGCHSGNNPRGNFSFTTFEQLLQGGPTGSTIVTGDPDASYIVDLVLRQEPLKMPQGQAVLKRSQAVALETWIKEGAHFDGTNPKAPLRELVPTEAQREAELLAKMTDMEFAARRIDQTAALWKRVAPRTEAVSATSPNFYVYGSVTEARLKELSQLAEAHLRQLEQRFPLPEGASAFRGRLAIFVTRDRFDYTEFNTVLMNRRTPESVSGHAVINPNFETAYLAMQDTGAVESADALTSEELMKSLLSELYLTRDGSRLPDWLRQGFGILECGLNPDAPYLKALKIRAEKALSTMTDPGKLFDDGTLAPEEVGAVGYLLIRFMTEQGGPVRFQKFVSELRKNPDAANAVKQVYGTSAAQLGRQFLRSGGG